MKHLGKFSLHVKHYKATQVVGIDRHNRRLTEKHSNSCIDAEKSKENITIVPVKESLYKDVKARIEQEVIAKGNRVTKASVWVSEICCSLPKGISQEDSESYFKEIVKYFENWLGKDNVMFACIHRDETLQHLHLAVTSITTDGKLSRKQIWTRQKLIEIHDELPKILREKGFDVERGDRLEDLEDKSTINLSLKEYKVFKEKAKLQNEFKELVNDYNHLVDVYNQSYRECVELKQHNIQMAQKVIANCQARTR